MNDFPDTPLRFWDGGLIESLEDGEWIPWGVLLTQIEAGDG